MKSSPRLNEKKLSTGFLDGVSFDTFGANGDPHDFTSDYGSDFMQIWQETAAFFIVGMTYIIANLGFLTTDFAFSRHVSNPPSGY